PATVTLLGVAPELQSPDLGRAGGQSHRDAPRAAPFTASQNRVQGGQLQELIGRDLQQITSVVPIAHGGGIKGKQDGLSQGELQFRFLKKNLLPLRQLLRYDTKHIHVGGLARYPPAV